MGHKVAGGCAPNQAGIFELPNALAGGGYAAVEVECGDVLNSHDARLEEAAQNLKIPFNDLGGNGGVGHVGVSLHAITLRDCGSPAARPLTR